MLTIIQILFLSSVNLIFSEENIESLYNKEYIASSYAEEEFYEDAIIIYQDILNIKKNIFGEFDLQLIETLYKISDLYLKIDNLDLSKQYLVTDPDSFFFASKYNPVFIRDNNKLSVFPVPSAQEEAYKVYEIKYPEFYNNGNTLKASTNIDDIGIENFPSSFHPHLVLHGVLKSLNRIYNVMITEEEDIELSNSIANSIKNLKEDYVNMFVSKDVLAPQAQQPQQRRG